MLRTNPWTFLMLCLGDEGSQSPHSFKPTSFSIPTTCGYCKVWLPILEFSVKSTYSLFQSSIWGLSKQGKTCKTCGLCVHAKCELKVIFKINTLNTNHRLYPLLRFPQTAAEGHALRRLLQGPIRRYPGQAPKVYFKLFFSPIIK